MSARHAFKILQAIGLFFSALLLLTASVSLPEEASEPSSFEDIGMHPGMDILVIPLKNFGRVYMIEAIVDNVQGNLIFDTGASSLVLNSTYFRKSMQKEVPDPRGITGSAGSSGRITTHNMLVSGLRYSNTSAMVTNLGHIEDRYGVKVLGLFGFSLLRDYEVVIDLHANQLRIYRIDNRGNRLSSEDAAFKGDHTQSIEEADNIVFIYGNIEGKKLRFCIDTGAETNAIDLNCPEKVLKSISVHSTAALSGAGAAKSEVLVGKMNELMLGSSSLKNMTTIVTRLDALEDAYGQMMDGVLGYDFLARGPVCVNFVKKQLSMIILKEEQK
jgi:predicted aspartyl protease